MTSKATLELLQAEPTWVDIAGFTNEKVHTNVIARALGGPRDEARALAAALWNRAAPYAEPAHATETIAPEMIRDIKVVREHRLAPGTNGVIDLCIDLTTTLEARRLAVEVKVDGSPDGAQLASMAQELTPNDRIVLLTLGAAQVCRMEARHLLPAGFEARNWWRIKDVFAFADLIEAASPARSVARAWVEELKREELRRELAYEDGMTAALCRRNERVLAVYRYHHVAAELASHETTWVVSVPRHGVVMTLRNAHVVTFEGAEVRVYLEVAGHVVRVKAGTNSPVDPRKSTARLLPIIRAELERHGFQVETKLKPGQWVTLFALDRHRPQSTRESLVAQMKRAMTAWCAIKWAEERVTDG